MNRIYSARSYYEAIGLVAREAEDRHSEVMDKLHVIEAALTAIFSTQPAAKETALAIADNLATRAIPEGVDDRLSAVAAGLRKLALASPEEASAGMKFAVAEGSLSTE